MSYVINIANIKGRDRFRVTSIEILEAACRRLGLEFLRGQTHYRVYSRAQASQPRAAHVIRLSAAQEAAARAKIEYADKPYEIGVVRNDADDCWYLTSDNDPYMAGSQMLATVCGPIVYPEGKDRYGAEPESGFGLLMQAYFVENALATAHQLGHRATAVTLPDGTIEVDTEDPHAVTNLASAHA